MHRLFLLVQLKTRHRWQWRRSPRPAALGVVGSSSLWWRHGGKLLCPVVVCPVWSLRIHQTSHRIDQPKQSQQKGKRGSDETDLQKAEFRHVSLRISSTVLSKEQKHTRATLPSIPEVNNTYWLKNTYFYSSCKLTFQIRRENMRLLNKRNRYFLNVTLRCKIKMPPKRPKTPLFLTRRDDGLAGVVMYHSCARACVPLSFSCHDIIFQILLWSGSFLNSEHATMQKFPRCERTVLLRWIISTNHLKP